MSPHEMRLKALRMVLKFYKAWGSETDIPTLLEEADMVYNFLETGQVPKEEDETEEEQPVKKGFFS
jgi:hypothetical protein